MDAVKFVVTFVFFCLGLLKAEEEFKGTVELSHEPKNCVTTPCPQYRVLSIDGEKPTEPLGADLVNFDSRESSVSAFKKFYVKGTWKKTDRYLEITVSEWFVTLREKVPSKAIRE
jgi:hypothetical protein